MKRASLADIAKMKAKGELFHDPAAPEGARDDAVNLDAAFWAKAVMEAPRKPRSVHLKLDPDVFDFFHAESNGKGHLTRMQNVLKAYVRARKAG